MEAVREPIIPASNSEGNQGEGDSRNARDCIEYPPRSTFSSPGPHAYRNQAVFERQFGCTRLSRQQLSGSQEIAGRRNANEWEQALSSFLAHSGPICYVANSAVSDGATLRKSRSSSNRGSGSSDAPIESDRQREVTMELSSSPVEDRTTPVENSSIGSSSTSVRNEESETALSTEHISPRTAFATGTGVTNIQSPPVSTNVSRVESPYPLLRDISQRVLPVLSVSGTRVHSTRESDTGRRFLAADLHLFKILDAQERRRRACEEVWGIAPGMGCDLNGSSSNIACEEASNSVCPNRNVRNLGICFSESVLFGPEFYGPEQRPLGGTSTESPDSTAPDSTAPNHTVGIADSSEQEERSMAITSEIDRLFNN